MNKKPHLLGKKVGKNNIKIMKKIRIQCVPNAHASKLMQRYAFFSLTLSLGLVLENYSTFCPLEGYSMHGKSDGIVFMRQQSLLGGHDQLTSVVQVAVHVVSTVHHVHGASGRIDGHVRGFSLVMCSSLSASGMRLSSFRMCHFFVILTS